MGSNQKGQLETFQFLLKRHIQDKSFWTRCIVWSLAFGFLLGMTLRDFLLLLADYKESNIATQVNVVAMDFNFRPPQLILGIPLLKSKDDNEPLMQIASHLYNGTEDECVLCKALTENSWNVWNSSNVTRLKAGKDAFYDRLSFLIFQKLLTAPHSELSEILDGDPEEWRDAIISSVIDFFSWLATSDYVLSPYDIGIDRELAKEIDINNFVNRLTLLFKKLLEQFCRQLLTFTEVLDPNGFQKPLPINRSCYDLLLNASVPVELDAISGLWIPLPLEQMPVAKEYKLEISRNSSLSKTYAITDSSIMRGSFLFHPDPAVMYFTAAEQAYAGLLFDTPTMTQDFDHQVTISYTVQMKAKDVRSNGHECHKDSPILCLTKCTKQWIAKTCGCWLFTYRIGMKREPEMPYCNWASIACNISSIPDAERERCAQQCSSPCEYTSYTWQVGHEMTVPKNNNVTELILKLSPTFGTFAEFSWTVKSPPEQFISQIGGIVNLYLGFSGISIFAFLITCIEAIRRWMSNKTADQTGRRNAANGDIEAGKLEVVCMEGKFSEDGDELSPAKVRAEFRRIDAILRRLDSAMKSEVACPYKPENP